MALVQGVLAFLFIVYLGMILIDFEDKTKEKIFLVVTSFLAFIFITSFYLYVGSFGTKLNVYPFFIVSEEKNGFSNLLLDLSQITGLLLFYKVTQFLLFEKKRKEAKIQGSSQ